MYLAHENTESLLNGFIDSISANPQSWRVISIEFQDCDTLRSTLFQNICLKNLNSCFEQTECRIYWVRPAFILVFFQGRALPIEKCIEVFLKETEFKGFGRFFDILDLSIHWSNLKELMARIYKPVAPSSTMAIEPIAVPPHATDGFSLQLSPDKIRQMRSVRSARIKPLLLLVEDDPFTQQLTKLALKDYFDIISAETARQALAYYQRHLPNMVFEDIQLPDGNGINLLKQMCEADTEAYVVMMSSHAQKEKIMECLSHGAKGFIAKPFTRQLLLDAAQKFKETRKTLIGGVA